MNVHEGLDALKHVPDGAVMSIGNFDGVHLGHSALLSRLCEVRAATPGSKLAIMTFEPHPLTVLRPNLAPPRLTAPAIKERLLEQAGVDDLVVLAPTRDVLDLSAEQFWTILRDEVRPSHLVEGASFNFGKDRGGTITRLREWTAASNVQLHVVDAIRVPLLDLQVVEVSSSLIRWLISYGRVRDAAICLGRPYVLRGRVVKGAGRGRTIGVPTVNLACEDQLVPANGVYAARCTIDGVTYPAATNIGVMPTFGENHRQIEAHLIGFAGDLYGRVIELELLDWIREELKFGGVDQLIAQLDIDFAGVKARAGMHPQRAIASI